MNIFAVVKKAINSNLNKPLDIKMDEIKRELETTIRDAGAVKGTRMVANGIGVPYNTNYASQVLTMNDEPIVSIEGKGRILQVIPVTKSSVTKTVFGTTLFTVDGKTLLNNAVEFGTTLPSYIGLYMVDFVEQRAITSVVSNIFDANKPYNVKSTGSRVDEANSFTDRRVGIFNPNGIYFEQGFEIRLTQNNTNSPNDFGVIVVYELYE